MFWRENRIDFLLETNQNPGRYQLVAESVETGIEEKDWYVFFMRTIDDMSCKTIVNYLVHQ